MASIIIQWNIRGFRSNIEDLKSLISQHSPVCVALQETFLGPNDQSKIRRYSINRKDGENCDGRPCGGVAILTSHDIPSSYLPLQTSLQAVAVRLCLQSPVTICSLYLSPSVNVVWSEIENLVQQLPLPFMLLGDFNAHSVLWGSDSTNTRGKLIEKLLSDLDLCLLNDGTATYFHSASLKFSALDLSFCSPCLLPSWSWKVFDHPFGSDHFPVLLSSSARGCVRMQSSRWKMDCADWGTFTAIAVLTQDMVQACDIDEAVEAVTSGIIEAANKAIPKTSVSFPRFPKPWWNHECQAAYKAQKKAWSKFRRYPTRENLLSFKKAKSVARRIRRNSQKRTWRNYVSGINSSTSVKAVWDKIRKIQGNYTSHPLSILRNNGVDIKNIEEIANTLANSFSQVSSSSNYSASFKNVKSRAERNSPSFRSSTQHNYNCPFTITELRIALHKSGRSAPGPDLIHYDMIRHLSLESLLLLLFLFNRIWSEQVFPDSWRKAIVLPFPKPGKDPTNPSSYRPIALTSCLCKLLERMVNYRLVYFF